LARGFGMRHDDQQPDSREKALLAVRRELGALPHGWHALHGVRLGGVHIDHLVMGPAGIVALTTKFHPRARVATDGRHMQVNGVGVDHLKHVRIDAQRLGGLFSAGPMDQIPVAGGLVFVGLAECHLTGIESDTVVTVAGQLERTMQQLPHQISASEVAALAQTVQRLADC